MKTLRNFLLFGFAAFMLLNSGCKKYEEGPLLSIRSKKARIVNDWVVVKSYVNGKEEDLENTTEEMEFKDDYTGRYKYTGSSIFGESKYEINFKWDFNRDKTKLIINYLDDDGNEEYVVDYLILKLYENELWLKDQYGDDTYELHLEPK